MNPKPPCPRFETGYLTLGSNLGLKKTYLTQALELIDTLPLTSIKKLSPVYRTAPVGGSAQPYLNMVAQFESAEDPCTLMDELLEIEHLMGRRRSGVRNEDRVIDIDLLLFGDRVLETPTLIVPHPRMHERQFVLKPLCDLSPQLVHPVMGETVEALLKDVEKTGVWKEGPLQNKE